MRKLLPIGIVMLAALGGCGLEGLFSGGSHSAYPRPASKISGAATWNGAAAYQFAVIDGNGVAFEPFALTAGGGTYEVRLPSSQYSMVRSQARAGHLLLRALVPSLGQESAVGGVDLGARNMTETLIVEANLSAKGIDLGQLTPSAYDDPATGKGTRKQIRAAFDVPGPTQDLLLMVERLIAAGNPLSGDASPGFFYVPVLDSSFTVVKTPAVWGSPIGEGWLQSQAGFGNPVDYTGDGVPDTTSTAFDTLLGQVARLYTPEGCPDPSQVRLVFTVDFNEGCKDGACGSLNRFLWTTNKPGKTMFFVGWLHKDSGYQDPAIAIPMGNGVPNVVGMYDDGTNGDEVAQDQVYTITFDVPRDPAGVRKLRVGYKYTWGFQGQPWSGSEEWPGNSRIIQVDDLNDDGFVYRRDVYQDEASNKDKSNLNPAFTGTLGWDTDLRGCGIPETREQKVDTLPPANTSIVSPGNMCSCGTTFYTPPNLGTINAASDTACP